MRSLTERPLEAAERRVLDFLLSVADVGSHGGTIQALRDQAYSARVAERWECCPSVTFAPSVDGRCEGAPLIESRHRTEPFELLLFATADGTLGCMEIVHYAGGTLDAFPSIDEFEAPSLFVFPES